MNAKEFDLMLAKYADVIVRVGLNLRKGQRLGLRAILDDAPFVRKVVESAYKAGAKHVDVLWSDEKVTRARFEHTDPASLSSVPDLIFTPSGRLGKEG